MIGLHTLLGSKVRTSVRINGLYTPANSITKTLQMYTDPALFHTEGMGQFHLSKSGSLFRIRLCNRYFALVCAHQVLGINSRYELDQLCLHDRKGKILTSHRVIFPQNDEAFRLDVLLYEFTQSVHAGKLPSTGWYEGFPDEFNDPCPKPAKVVCIGYPSHRNNFNYEGRSYPIGPNAVWGEETPPSIQNLLAFCPVPAIAYEPNGMSGSPVFGLWLNDTEPQLFFAGLLTNASSRKFHFLPRRRILPLVQHALS